MFSFFRLKKPCAKPAGIKRDLALASDRIILKCLPKVFEFFLKSTTTSRIAPFIIERYFPCENLVCKCKPLITFFLELDVHEKTNFLSLKFFFLKSSLKNPLLSV